MDPRLFWEWAQMDDHIRRAIAARDGCRRARHRANARPRGRRVPTFIVSRAEPRTYAYVKHALRESVDVIVDRRIGDRRQTSQPAVLDRRSGERRHRDVASELETSGWALVHRQVDL